MKEWIIKNTTITESQYDSIINQNTVILNNETQRTKDEEFINHPIKNINLFTLQKPSYFKRRKFQITKEYDHNKKKYYIYKGIKFYVLAEFLKETKYWLYSTERFKQCFILNSYLCENLKTNCNLITALCISPYRKNHQEYLHTFIQVISNNQEYIIDGTANIIMKKDIYYKIYQPKIISIISKVQLQQDIPLINEFYRGKRILRAEYLCFPSETIDAIKKLKK